MDTIIERLSQLSLEINGLVIPGSTVERTLARHSFNLFVHNDDPTYKISLLGSATAVRYGARYLLLTTQHQIAGTDPERISMLTDDGEISITSSGLRSFTRTSADTDAFDLVAFDFTEPCIARPDLRRRFFNLSRVPPDVLTSKIVAFLLTGFPFADQTYEVHESNHLGLGRRLVTCLPDHQPADDALLCLKPVSPLTDDPDGMSGGSAFVVQETDGHFNGYFAGLIVRGGKNRFYILKAGYVMAFLKGAFAD